MSTIQPFDTRDNFTRIHNYVIDVIMPMLKPNTFKVLMAIVRKTKGWGKDADQISYSQLRDLTGIKSDSTLAAALSDLEKRKYIFVNKADGETNTYSLNTSLEIVEDEATSTKTVDHLYKNCRGTSTKTVDTKETIKETKQKKEDPPSPLPSRTGDPLVDMAVRKFERRGKALLNSWQAELNVELDAKKRTPLASRLAEIWKMTRSIEAGNDRDLRKCHEVAVRLYSMGVSSPEVLDVHYNAYVADEWRRKNNPNPSPEALERFISQSMGDIDTQVTVMAGVTGELGFNIRAMAGGVL